MCRGSPESLLDSLQRFGELSILNESVCLRFNLIEEGCRIITTIYREIKFADIGAGECRVSVTEACRQQFGCLCTLLTYLVHRSCPPRTKSDAILAHLLQLLLCRGLSCIVVGACA